MHTNESVTLTRYVEASVVPVGTKITLQEGEQACITQHTEETRVPAPQGRKTIAQGNALGECGPFVISPEWATQNHRTTRSGQRTHSVSPFQGLFRFTPFSQGVTLGYLIPPLLG